MIFFDTLQPVQAGLQLCSLLFLIFGFILIRQRAVTGHTLLVCLAFVTTSVSLAVILGVLFFKEPQILNLTHLIEWIHYTVWGVYIIVGLVIYPFIIIVLGRALTGKMIAHARMARPVMLVWMFFLALGLYLFWNKQVFLSYE